MAIKKNNKTITETWAPVIKKQFGVTDESKLEWMSAIAHNQALNEADGGATGGSVQMAPGAMGGVYAPYSTLYNTVGVGNVRPAGRPALTGADAADNSQLGSGDKFPALLPIALKVAAKTIGFELVNTTPMAGPSGVLPYMDYVYSGSKQPYGATPAYNAATANPGATYDFNGQEVTEKCQGNKSGVNNVYELYGLPHAFKAAITADRRNKVNAIKTAIEGVKNMGAEPVVELNGLSLEFIGWSRIDGDPMFKINGGTASLGAIFAEGEVDATIAGVAVKLNAPRMISMLEDSIQGFAGAGREDNDPWQGTYQDGTVLYEPMSRGTGELQYARQISLQFFTRNVTVGTISISSAVTQEQVTDLQKQWGIDVLKMVENACVNDLSNTINRHITSRLFALGWKNHCKLVEVEGPSANLNLSFDASAIAPKSTVAYAIPQGVADPTGMYHDFDRVSMDFRHIVLPANAAFENRDTLLKRLTVNFLGASNWILQRGRYGAATFAVTNITVATALQSNAQYAFSPIANNISQAGGSLYPCGTMFGMTIYVDPLMAANDCRVLVGRKGGKDEPGTHFCPYVMAEKVQFLSEGLAGAPKIILKSRYSLVDAGYYPETQYLTFVVDFAGII